jgi:hypothetical protein
MAQDDLVVANAAGATVRADINANLQALGTLQSGTAAPSTTYPYMLWADTTTGLLKQRNAANTAWITKGTLASDYWGIPASGISYAQGSPALLDATTVQAAIDELAAGTAATPPRGHIFGLQMSNAADTEHDITVAAGEAASTDTVPVLISLTSALTKQADATFAEGNNAGGMASGESLPGDGGTVNVWAIAKADGTSDVFFNNHATSGFSPTLPTGFIYKALIESVTTDGSNNIRGFINRGRTMLYKDPPAELSGTTIGTTGTNRALRVPDGRAVLAKVQLRLGAADATSIVYLSCPDVDNEAPSSASPPYGSGTQAASGDGYTGADEVITNTSREIRARSNSGTLTISLATLGWTWDRTVPLS